MRNCKVSPLAVVVSPHPGDVDEDDKLRALRAENLLLRLQLAAALENKNHENLPQESAPLRLLSIGQIKQVQAWARGIIIRTTRPEARLLAELKESAALRLLSIGQIKQLQAWARGIIIRTTRPEARLLVELKNRQKKIKFLEKKLCKKRFSKLIYKGNPQIVSTVQYTNHHYCFNYRDVNRSHINEEAEILLKVTFKDNSHTFSFHSAAPLVNIQYL